MPEASAGRVNYRQLRPDLINDPYDLQLGRLALLYRTVGKPALRKLCDPLENLSCRPFDLLPLRRVQVCRKTCEKRKISSRYSIGVMSPLVCKLGSEQPASLSEWGHSIGGVEVGVYRSLQQEASVMIVDPERVISVQIARVGISSAEVKSGFLIILSNKSGNSILQPKLRIPAAMASAFDLLIDPHRRSTTAVLWKE